jgi:hypothetical protein
VQARCREALQPGCTNVKNLSNLSHSAEIP